MGEDNTNSIRTANSVYVAIAGEVVIEGQCF
jgi:hypothetical protein